MPRCTSFHFGAHKSARICALRGGDIGGTIWLGHLSAGQLPISPAFDQDFSNADRGLARLSSRDTIIGVPLGYLCPWAALPRKRTRQRLASRWPQALRLRLR